MPRMEGTRVRKQTCPNYEDGGRPGLEEVNWQT